MASQQLDDERIFHIARGILDPDLRCDYLDQICAGDQALRERVDSLLLAHEQEQSFLQSAKPDLAPTVDQKPLDQKPITERPGQEIGRYKLLQKIGEGGFGVVFMAEQLRPVRRKVALKVIKPGMDSNAIVARFEAERQALAMMDHVNIARVLDGGATDSGRPYFVMELVKGVSITEYCDKNQLSTNDRLRLFATVCQAVQHAHQKGIIHRDLKPSNVLVTLADGQPIVKVIDFGVAKATNQQLTEKTLFTAYGQMVGTPQYMSPEQAEMSCLDVDTRSDVYSLGVILYELLTGSTPLEEERLRNAGYAEMQRLIRDEEPPKPSTRLSTSGDKLTLISKHRNVSPDKLKNQLRGDLDWIVMKALEKDRNRRYESASSVADDVQRYLGNEPIEARPPSSGYRLQKFVVRNKPLFATTAVVVFLLVGATVVSAKFAIQMYAANYRAQQTLDNYHGLLIESAMTHAALGDIEEVLRTLKMTKDTSFPEDWRQTLEGVTYLHRGENDKAIERLREAVAFNEANVSANAMLAFAYFHTGQWDEWKRHGFRVQQMKPRPEFREFDELFLCYFNFYVDFKETESKLREIVDKHQNWIVPRGLLADTLSNRAFFLAEKDAIKESLEEIQVPMLLAGDNRFLKMIAFHVHSVATQLLGADAGESEVIANRLASELEAYPEYGVSALVRSVYYDHTAQTSKAHDAWRSLIEHSDGMLIHWAAAGLLRDNLSLSVVNGSWHYPEAKIARAYVLATSSNDRDQQEALRIYDDLRGDANTWFLRHLVIQIPLLLRKADLAQIQCKNWLNQDTLPEIDYALGGGEREAIRQIATLETFSPTDKTNGTRKLFLNFQSALIAHSLNRDAEAIHFLDRCRGLPGMGFWEWWIAAFTRIFSGSSKVDESFE